MTAGPHDYARFLKEQVAPVLSEGMLLALRDQPQDPAAYMAEFLSSRGADTAVTQALYQKQLADEHASLEAEMAMLQQQLQAARAEASLRLPVSKPKDRSPDEQALYESEVHCAASWHESLRLKKLMRAMKLQIAQPLVAADWLLPEGLVLACAAPFLELAPLCEKIAADFSASFEPHRPNHSNPPIAELVAPVDHSLKLVERSPEKLLDELGSLAGGGAYVCMYVHIRRHQHTRVHTHRPAAPRQSSGVPQTG